MNNFSTFLDTSTSGAQNSMPRAAPSPSPSLSSLSSLSQQSAQHSQASNHLPNGLGNQPAAIPLVNGLPSGVQQTDLNHLWSVVQQLSQVLEENRAQTRGVVEGVQALQARAGEDGASPAVREVNGEINGTSPYLCSTHTPTWAISSTTHSIAQSLTHRRSRLPLRSRNLVPAKPSLDRPVNHHRPHILKHTTPVPDHRLRIRPHPPPRQTEAIRVQPDPSHPLPAQTLRRLDRNRAKRKSTTTARARRVASRVGEGGEVCEAGVGESE